MNARTERVILARPLRDVVLASVRPQLDEFEQQLRQREQAGYERGRKDGEREVSERLIQQRTEMQALQKGVLDSLGQVVPRLARDCESGLVTLAIEVAQKLVAGLPVSKEMIEAAIQEALTQIEETTEIHIHLNPEDLALLQQLQSPLLTPAGADQPMQFHGSTDVTRGGCLVRTRFGVIDARRETKIELLKKTLSS